MKTPVDLQEHVFHHGAMLYDRATIPAPSLALFEPSVDQRAVAVSQGGRQAAWYVEGQYGAGLLRHYRRGGWMARLTADRYIWQGKWGTRSFAECRVLADLYEQGLRVPRPLAAAYWRRGLVYRAAILVERIPDVQTLAVKLDDAPQEPVAQAIYRLHEAGVWHADLNAHNILINSDNDVWLIDFDKARRTLMTEEKRRANLLRLRRSLIKVAGDRGMAWWGPLSLAYDTLLRARSHV